MALTLRLNQANALTYTELDGNFVYLDGRITSVSSSLNTRVSNVSSSIVSTINAVSSSLVTTINSVSSSTGTRITNLSSSVSTSITNLSSSVSTSITNLSSSLATDISNSTPGGNDSYIQYNNGGVFGGESFFIYNDSHNSVQLGLDTSALGGYSYAQGDTTSAPGLASHAHGKKTIASGSWSHAEGESTIVTGRSSHAEGIATSASGDWSHAEGNTTITIGNYSHAEGESTITIGDYSHTEGFRTVALGSWSHASGYGTVASGSYQTVIGKYNKQGDDTPAAFIIGNGTLDTARNTLFKAAGSNVEISGSLSVSSSVYISASLGNYTNVIVLDTGSGKLYYTSSIGGTQIDTGSFITTGSSSTNQSITGSLTISGSLKATGSLAVSGTLLLGGLIKGDNPTTNQPVITGVYSGASSDLSGSFANRFLPKGYNTFNIYFNELNSGVNSIRLPDPNIGETTGPLTITAQFNSNTTTIKDAYGSIVTTILSMEWVRLVYNATSTNWQVLERNRFGETLISNGSSNILQKITGSLLISGSFITTGSVLLNGLVTSSDVTNVLTYDTASGKLYYTASSAIGGTQVNTSGLVTTSSFNVFTGSVITTGSAGINQSITGSLRMSGSYDIKPSFTSANVASLTSVNTSTGQAFGALVLREDSDGTGNVVTLKADSLNADRTISLPNAGGTLVISVNNQTANADGNVSISTTAIGAVITTGSISTTQSITGSLVLSGSLSVSGTVYLPNIVTSSATVSNVLMYGANGQLFVTASSAIGGGTTTTSTPSNLIYSGSVTASVNIGTSSFQLTSGSSTFLFVSNSGNFGVGTSLPQDRLHVSGNLSIRSGSDVNSSWGMLKIGTADPSNASHYAAIGSSGYGSSATKANLSFYTDGGTVAGSTEKMKIQGNGNILIGNGIGFLSSSTFKLDVNAGGGGGAGDSAFRLNIDSADKYNIAGSGSHIVMTNDNASGQNVIASYINDKFISKIRSTYDGDMNYVVSGSGNHYLWTGGDQDTGSIVLFVTGSQSVGIRTITPKYNLTVSGSVGFLNMVTASVAVTNVLMISSSGQLFVTASSAIGGTPSPSNLIYSGSVSASVNTNSASFQITSGSTNFFFVSSSGYVGIGTTTPSATLTVSGSFTVASGSTEFSVLGTGVKIGNDSSDFHTITGSINISGSLTMTGSAYFSSSKFVINSTELSLQSSGMQLGNDAADIHSITGSVRITGSLYVGNAFTIYQENLNVAIPGYTTIVSVNTGSAKAAFFDYVMTNSNGPAARAGTVMAVWTGTTIEYTEASTNDIGNTFGVTLVPSISGPNVRLQASASISGWSIKSAVRLI